MSRIASDGSAKGIAILAITARRCRIVGCVVKTNTVVTQACKDPASCQDVVAIEDYTVYYAV